MPAAIERAHAVGGSIQLCLATSFTCPFDGPVDPDRVVEIACDPRTDGAADIVVADTLGQAVPGQVSSLVARLAAESPDRRIVYHGHDTWGLGVANSLAAIDAGATVVDGALAGLGGCPFAPGASGNTASEDLLFATRPSWLDPEVFGSLVRSVRTSSPNWTNRTGRVPGRAPAPRPRPSTGCSGDPHPDRPRQLQGTYTAVEVADAIASGVESAGHTAIRMPVADGGEGTLDALAGPLGLARIEVEAVNPWRAPCRGLLGMSSDGTAVVELATASGITTPHDGPRDAVIADTYGTGMVMAEAVRRGARHIVVAAGGSATTDGGAGAIAAIDERGGLGEARVTVLSDVTTRYTDAARIFGPQKGADAAAVALLTRRLEETALTLPRDPREVDGSGAAGGFSGGMWSRFGAELRSGADFVLDAVASTTPCAPPISWWSARDGSTASRGQARSSQCSSRAAATFRWSRWSVRSATISATTASGSPRSLSRPMRRR